VLPPALAVLRIPALVSHDKYAECRVFAAVDDRVREVGQGMHLPAIRGWCSEPWMLLEQYRNSLELCKESSGKSDSGFRSVEAHSFCEVFRGEPMDGPIH
jgi:hypothetical protein